MIKHLIIPSVMLICFTFNNECEAGILTTFGKRAETVGETIHQDSIRAENKLHSLFKPKRNGQIGATEKIGEMKTSQNQDGTTMVPGGEDKKMDTNGESLVKSIVNDELRCAFGDLELAGICHPPN
jgi:hypothetical protein